MLLLLLQAIGNVSHLKKESSSDRRPCLEKKKKRIEQMAGGHLAAGRAGKMLSVMEAEGRAARLLPAD